MQAGRSADRPGRGRAGTMQVEVQIDSDRAGTMQYAGRRGGRSECRYTAVELALCRSERRQVGVQIYRGRAGTMQVRERQVGVQAYHGKAGTMQVGVQALGRCENRYLRNIWHSIHGLCLPI